MKKTITFLSSHYDHRRVRDRIVGATAADFRIQLLAFTRQEREGLSSIYDDYGIEFTNLGLTPKGISLKRSYINLIAFGRLLLKRQSIANSDLVIINNFSLLLLFYFLWIRDRKVIYDLSDIHRAQYGNSIISSVVRFLEKLALERVNFIVVSSPWFAREYFRSKLRVTIPAILIENRIEPQLEGLTLAEGRATHNESAPRFLRLLWPGLLRCGTSLRVLRQASLVEPKICDIALAGDLTVLKDSISQHGIGAMSLLGEYNNNELGRMFCAADLVWAVDVDDGENSRWLLPNRLYQSLYFGVPLIALEGTATAAVVKSFSLGYILREPTLGSLKDCLAEVTQASIADHKRRLIALKQKAVRQNEWESAFRFFILGVETPDIVFIGDECSESYCLR